MCNYLLFLLITHLARQFSDFTLVNNGYASNEARQMLEAESVFSPTMTQKYSYISEEEHFKEVE